MVWHTTIGSGPIKAVVIHGWFSDHRIFAPTFDALDTGRHTYAFFDIRGYGRSRDVAGAFNIGEVAADACRRREHLLAQPRAQRQPLDDEAGIGHAAGDGEGTVGEIGGDRLQRLDGTAQRLAMPGLGAVVGLARQHEDERKAGHGRGDQGDRERDHDAQDGGRASCRRGRLRQLGEVGPQARRSAGRAPIRNRRRR